MKLKLLLLTACLATCETTYSQTSLITLNPGESVTYHFDTLGFSGFSTGFPALGGVAVLFDPTTLGADDALQFEIFEGEVTDTPLATEVFRLGSVTAGVSTRGAWQDLEGTVRLTMLSGSLNIDSVIIGAQVPVQNSLSVGMYRTVIAVPEPNVAGLLSGGLLAAGLWRYRNHRRSNVT